MPCEPVFYSFHFDNDVMRVQLIRQMGVIEGDEPVSANEWEKIKGKGAPAIERWIDDNMKYKRCVVVLIGAETASRPWVKFEIQKAWQEKRGLLGIHIHNLKCARTRSTCAKGANPFGNWTVGGQPMAELVDCYDPNARDAYNDIASNLEGWVAAAIARAKKR